MNPTKLNVPDAYKECAGAGCSNPGRSLLEIRYIKKQGYFCTACAKDLLQNELAVSLKRITSMRIGKPADMRQRGQEKLTKEESNMGQTFPDSKLSIRICMDKTFSIFSLLGSNS